VLVQASDSILLVALVDQGGQRSAKEAPVPPTDYPRRSLARTVLTSRPAFLSLRAVSAGAGRAWLQGDGLCPLRRRGDVLGARPRSCAVAEAVG